MNSVNQNQVNFTNLVRNYMYGKDNRNVFYKQYKNSENDIDDPIFTGFTLSLDFLHSPLFFAGKNNEYISTHTLRGAYNDISLAETIENRLKEVYKFSIEASPDGYDIYRLNVKDKFFDDIHKIGYGLQENIYQDSVLYGATDYIYMVDKVYESNVSDNEREYIGDGNVHTNKYTELRSKTNTITEPTLVTDNTGSNVEIAREELMEKLGITYDEEKESYIKNGEVVENIDDYISDADIEDQIIEDTILERKTKIESGLTEEDENFHNELSEDIETAKTNISNVEKNLAKIEKELNDCKNNLSNISDSFNKYQTEMNSLLNSYTQSKSKHITNDTDTLANKINNCYEKFIKEFDISDKTNFTITKPKDEELNKKVTNTSDSDTDLQRKAYTVIDCKISLNQSAGYNEQIAELTDKINLYKTKLYGDSTRGKSNPTNDSLYGKLLKMQDEYNNDRVTLTKNATKEYDQLLTDFQDMKEFENTEYSQISYSSGVNKTPESETVNKTYDGPSTEVSQTVYDIVGFISGMKRLTTEYPYILQTVSGLDEAYKKYFNFKDTHMGSGDGKISITCFESLDLRITSMFNKYFNAVYDRQYKRERVPINLRRFNCSIFVHDIRNFRHALSLINDKFVEKKTGDGSLSQIVEVALNSLSAIEFKFYDCEIVQEETGNLFNNVSNADMGEQRTTNFAFTYGNCVINLLPFEDLMKYYSSANSNDLDKQYYAELSADSNMVAKQLSNTETMDGNNRMWYDRSPLGNVNNNDYKEIIRKDHYTAVDDYYKSTVANSFATNSIVNRQTVSTKLDDAVNRMLVGVASSTAIPTRQVADMIGVSFIDGYVYPDGEKLAVISKITGNKDDVEPIGMYNNLGTIENNSGEIETINNIGNVNNKNKKVED